jgi:hypothetical protein
MVAALLGPSKAAGSRTSRTRGTKATPVTLIWIDSREAIVTRLVGDEARFERIESDVAAHHRSTGHVRHDPLVRHGGGRAPTADESRRLQHLDRYLDGVAARLPSGDDLLVVGPGKVRVQLARRIVRVDTRHGTTRKVDCLAEHELTRHQLVARLRHVVGEDAPRRSDGAGRRGRRPGDSERPRRGRRPAGRRAPGD